MTDVTNLNAVRADRADDNRLWTPADTIRDVLGDIEAGRIEPDKILVLHWKTGEDDFHTGWAAANMKSSEMIALMEMVKATLLRDMGLT